MNIFLRTALFIIAAVAVGPIRLPGQSVFKDTLDAFRDKQGDYYFETALNGGITVSPRNGKVFVNAISNTPGGLKMYHLIYKPNPGFVGLDTFSYQRLTCLNATCQEVWEVIVRVRISEVKAQPDLFYVPINSPGVSLAVMRNDVGSSGGLGIARVGMVNNGEAVVDEGQSAILFKPREGFSGFSQISYTVCDSLGTCDQAMANVVVGRVQGKAGDTLHLFTVRDAAVDVLVPNLYALFDYPRYGALNLNRDIPLYTPPPGFVGTDEMLFLSREGALPVLVTVLDVAKNVFARDDIGYVTPGRKLEINVLSNDLHGLDAGCVRYSQPIYGKLRPVEGAPGLLTYEAPSWFVGVDEFTYRSQAPDCEGTEELATVRIVVSNFEPLFSKFRMSTLVNTPLVISYDVPISGFKFNISQKAKLGSLLYLPGTVDTLISGARVRGANVLLYVPNANSTGFDAFEVSYCLAGLGSKPCRYQKSVKVEMDILPFGDGKSMCVDDCVWVGDANRDGMVNMQDMLSIGQYLGETGAPRPDANQDVWYGQSGEGWKDEIFGELPEIKYLDSDGDGFITALDTVAIARFYGRTRNLVPMQLPVSEHEIRLEGDIFVEPGQEVSLDLLIGDEDHPVTDLHGFSFELNFNPLFFDPEVSSIEFADNSWLTYNAPVMTMHRNNGEGKVEAGFSRTNGGPAVGYGKVGRSKVVVTVDIIGVAPPDSDGNIQIPIEGGWATAVNGAGQSYAIRVAPFHLNVRTREDTDIEEGPKPLEKLLLLFPNPGTDYVQLYLPGQRPMEKIQVFNLAGQMLFDSGEIAVQQYAVPVRDWMPGMYFVRIQADGQMISRKFEVQH